MFAKRYTAVLAKYNNVHRNLISAIQQTNMLRKDHIDQTIIDRIPKKVDIYRLTIKSNIESFCAKYPRNRVFNFKVETG